MFVEIAKFVTKNLFNVEGWVCVVSGGGTGLMIAQAFANNGAKVYITSCRQASLKHITKQWGSSLAHPKGNFIPTRSNVELVQEIGKQEDHIDLLVNNAGISEVTNTLAISLILPLFLVLLYGTTQHPTSTMSQRRSLFA
ncbi:uncharacterized protein HD556DRAFT_1532562 [Suillus plorans]|uniref:NAD(P)-binding protein n=1 Tax=Suillus plorans TaxID=116603 RepID=A0A9P7DZ05_9AGAM|nr:uncharacterized protein HD556DRAFT_1532562 [Suillus plorans]KAG1806531.1 hypothetical protein HD556DRAFT_1532562 [Suillus plorans]